MTRRSILVLAALAVAGVGFTGCFGEDDAGVLLDGTPAREAPVDLEGVDARTVLTATSVFPVASLETGLRCHTCIEEQSRRRAAEGISGVAGRTSSESLTVREAGGRSRCPRMREQQPGRAKGDDAGAAAPTDRLGAGRLDDPSLDVGMHDERREDGWFRVVRSSDETTRFLAVRQPGYIEVYEVAGGLPVRVATVSEVEGSRATFDLSEHDAEGQLLRRDRVEMAVAG